MTKAYYSYSTRWKLNSKHPPISRTRMNSGDWVESLSALVEDHDGNWRLLYYTTDLARHEENKAVKRARKLARVDSSRQFD